MNPLVRATAATLALVGLSDGNIIRSSSSSNNNNNVDTRQQPRHLGSDEHSIGVTASSRKSRMLNDDFVPPWADAWTQTPTNNPTQPPTNRPTLPPTADPTSNPTQSPTLPAPPTVSPTAGNSTGDLPTDDLPTANPINASATSPPPTLPTASPTNNTVAESAITTTTAVNNLRQTSCTAMPEMGNFVTETLDIEYMLFLNYEKGSLEDASLQGIVDSSIEPMFHRALADIGLGCEHDNFVSAKHVMVVLSSSGRDLLGSDCASIDNDGLLLANNATDCYTVWGQVTATMWFAPRRVRSLQSASTTTPFGDREAFNEFTTWLEEALDSLGGSTIADVDAEVVRASFQGYVNLGAFDGTNTDLTRGDSLGVDIAAAFMDSGLKADESGISLVWGLVAVVAGALVLLSAIVIMVVRRRKRNKAVREKFQVVDELELDAKDDLNDDADLVDDESLFKEDNPLPENLQVKLESGDHDYRWIGEKRNEDPIFVATERNKEFRDHLATLKLKKEQELRARQYESVML